MAIDLALERHMVAYFASNDPKLFQILSNFYERDKYRSFHPISTNPILPAYIIDLGVIQIGLEVLYAYKFA